MYEVIALSTTILVLVGWAALSLVFLTGYVYGASVGRRRGFEAGWRAALDELAGVKASGRLHVRPADKRVTS
jgi:hypothetical protein